MFAAISWWAKADAQDTLVDVGRLLDSSNQAMHDQLA